MPRLSKTQRGRSPLPHRPGGIRCERGVFRYGVAAREAGQEEMGKRLPVLPKKLVSEQGK